jgi:signal transduction histidine kinase
MQKITDNIFLLVLFAMTGTFILAAAFILFFLKYQRRAVVQKEALQKAEIEHGKQLLQATLLSQEEERKRIGQDLHDEVGAALSNLKMMMAQNTGTANDKHKPLIDNIIGTVRHISHTLSPPGLDLFGLEFILHELFDTVNASGGLQIHLENAASEKMEALNKKTARALYRVIQELLSNTIKHAAASNAYLVFSADHTMMSVTYRDDGKGIADGMPEKHGMGMQNIEARLRMIPATFEITTATGKGFFIKINIPENKQDDE